MSLFAELKRRNVFKVGIAYAVSTWILLQLTDVVSQILVLPEWAPKLVLLLLVVGFVPALIFAWAFEMTPEGIKLESEVNRERSVTRSTGRKLDYVIIVLLGLSLAYFIWEARFKQRAEQVEALQQSIEQQATEPAPPVREISAEDAEMNRNSIAVLPFANRSADEADQYFTDGIHDDLLTQLSKIADFSVISRTSVMEYRDTTKNLREIAGELSVAHIMEGAVQRSGNRVRINVQLIDADSDDHLWAEIYDRELTTDNLFDIQSEIAKNIASALEATLSETELSSVSDVPTENVAAYDMYLQAKQSTLSEDRNGYRTALELYRQALELDPEFKLAWIGLADVHITNYWFFGGDPADRDKARAAIDRAKSIDGDFPELHLAEGFYAYWGFLDYERALYFIERALEKIPGNARAHMWHAWASRRAGRFDQTLTSMQTALRLDPRAGFHWGEYGSTLTALYRYEEAREVMHRARDLDPANWWIKAFAAGLALQAQGDVEQAVRLTTGAQYAFEASNFETYLVARLADRRFEEALETLQAMPRDLEVSRGQIQLKESLAAQIQFMVGNSEEARAAADAAWFRLKGMEEQLGEDYRVEMARVSLAPIRGESRDEILERIARVESMRPVDAWDGLSFQYSYARVLAMAGLVRDAVASLEPQFTPPSNASVQLLEVDPWFDRISNDPEFMTLLERHR